MKAMILALLAFFPVCASASGGTAVGALLRQALIVDGHNDFAVQVRNKRSGHVDGLDFGDLEQGRHGEFQTDLSRLRKGRVGGQFWSVYVPATLAPDEAVRATLEEIDIVKRLVAANSSQMVLVHDAGGVERAFRSGKIASLLGAEGGHSIGNSLAVLRQLHELGVGYMTLTHTRSTDWANSATDQARSAGLSSFGIEVVHEMNRLGMLVDLSHTAPTTMAAALDASAAPVIFSHSNSFAIVAHPRNVPDDILRRLATNGGVIMVAFVPQFISSDVYRWNIEMAGRRAELAAAYPSDPGRAAEALKAWAAAHPRPAATIGQLADHIDHIRKVAGIDHIGIGSDLDGTRDSVKGLEDASKFPDLFRELARRGYSPSDLRKIASGNILRVMRAAGEVSRRLQASTPPAEQDIQGWPE